MRFATGSPRHERPSPARGCARWRSCRRPASPTATSSLPCWVTSIDGDDGVLHAARRAVVHASRGGRSGECREEARPRRGAAHRPTMPVVWQMRQAFTFRSGVAHGSIGTCARSASAVARACARAPRRLRRRSQSGAATPARRRTAHGCACADACAAARPRLVPGCRRHARRGACRMRRPRRFGGGAVLARRADLRRHSTDAIVTATRAGLAARRSPPAALHDAAAVTIGRSTYSSAAATASSQLDTIVAGRSRAPAPRRRSAACPRRSSDQAGAAIGRTAYIVGGYTGTRWLDTIVAWQPGRARARRRAPAAHAPLCGGRRRAATGSSSPAARSRTGRRAMPCTHYVPVDRTRLAVGRLPAPTTHAAAATLGSTPYVVGGRGASSGTPTAGSSASTPPANGASVAGPLGRPLSDLAAVGTPRGILVARRPADATSGTVADLTELVPGVAGAVGGCARRPPLATAERLRRRRAGNLSAVARTRAAARLRPEQRQQHRRRDRPAHVQDRRALRGRRAAAARRARLGPEDALRHERQRATASRRSTRRPASPGATIPVDDPYNMYFTPDGRYAIVVAERLQRLDFRDAHTFALHHSLDVPCRGVDHMDFSADGRYAIVSCEFSGQIAQGRRRAASASSARSSCGPGAVPQDVKLSPDGKVFYVADMTRRRLARSTATRFACCASCRPATARTASTRAATRATSTSRTAARARSRSSRSRTRRIVAHLAHPGGGSPDMGNVSADGKVLWLSGRYNAVVYAISTRTAACSRRSRSARGPHGVVRLAAARPLLARATPASCADDATEQRGGLPEDPCRSTRARAGGRARAARGSAPPGAHRSGSRSAKAQEEIDDAQRRARIQTRSCGYVSSEPRAACAAAAPTSASTSG